MTKVGPRACGEWRERRGESLALLFCIEVRAGFDAGLLAWRLSLGVTDSLVGSCLGETVDVWLCDMSTAKRGWERKPADDNDHWTPPAVRREDRWVAFVETDAECLGYHRRVGDFPACSATWIGPRFLAEKDVVCVCVCVCGEGGLVLPFHDPTM